MSNNQRGMSIIVIRKPSGLIDYVPEWMDLARDALEPNIFYEPWFMLPAIKAFAEGRNLEFVLVFASDPVRPSSPPLLCGLFPLERKGSYKGLPVSVLTLWRHLHCFLCTPLVRRSYAAECIATFFEWLRSPQGCALMEVTSITDHGPFHQLLIDYTKRSSKLTYVAESFTRALLLCRANAEEYEQATLSTKHRKTLKRLKTRLGERGHLEYKVLGPNDAVEVWIEDFLRLETAGWKGREGSALASNEAQREFFVAAAMAGFKLGRFAMLAARLDDRLIAIRSQFFGGDGAFTFKIAFDEEFARFSPGVLLELENIRWFHRHPEFKWMDSCTGPHNSMFERLWLDRLTISTVLISTGNWQGDLVVSLIPLMRWFNRNVLRRKANVANEG